MSDFARFRALSFDCYGTLIDWEAGITAGLRRWADRRSSEAGDGELLHLFSTIEGSVQSEHAPALSYPDVLAETLRRIGAEVGVDVEESDADEFGASVAEWPAFVDSRDALARLENRFILIIVSNIDAASFAASNERLGVEFDLIITADDVGSYKPDDPHFRLLLESLDRFDLSRSQLLHVAQSLYHDHEPAARHGLPSVWIDRRHSVEGWGATPAPLDAAIKPKWRFDSMTSFADAAVG
jgi:2-haloalkanoic acid dehalogenase type II